jgi:cytochrome c biogenesis protein CcmG, thiol:disulfide interchange protein DsbE
MATAKKKNGGGLTPSQMILGGGIGALLLGAGAIAIFGGGSSNADVPDGYEQVRAVTVEGEALPLYDDALAGAADPAIGMPAPKVTGQSFDGQAVVYDPSDGKQLIMFVTHWCSHCQAEVPRVSPWLAGGNNAAPVNLVATRYDASLVGQGPTLEPSTWLEANEWPGPILADSAESEAASVYGLPAFPYYVLIGDDGNVMGRLSGEQSTQGLADFISDGLLNGV